MAAAKYKTKSKTNPVVRMGYQEWHLENQIIHNS